MSGLIYSHPVSVVLEARAGAWLDNVHAEARRLAERLGCDVAFTLNGKVHVVEPMRFELGQIALVD
jgi:thiamine pyrophosphate-dependent acetolactate synthase large subunit-like protein